MSQDLEKELQELRAENEKLRETITSYVRDRMYATVSAEYEIGVSSATTISITRVDRKELCYTRHMASGDTLTLRFA